MSLSTPKRSIMTLFSGRDDLESHQVRIVLAEKGIACEIIELDPKQLPEELIEANPYQTVPTLIDRDLVLYEAHTIIEYLDERFPHPPLMPVYPVARARSRLMMYRIKRDWYGLWTAAKESTLPSDKICAIDQLNAEIIAVSTVFNSFEFFMSEEFGLVDCYLAPLLWRLIGIRGIPSGGDLHGLHRYIKNLFSRQAFMLSLTEAEKRMAHEQSHPKNL